MFWLRGFWCFYFFLCFGFLVFWVFSGYVKNTACSKHCKTGGPIPSFLFLQVFVFLCCLIRVFVIMVLFSILFFLQSRFYRVLFVGL